ncbi:hypothetical protein CKY28_17615 [Sphingomonas lenta]|uniref:Uncharacterized protein n=2 Tax=Sphingomonas lenta TaxID=1141887 RepID=A0A2A2SB67_9SPHN|nr:hypothetical protein CKY28_17615 [Sphingomonas lenta]
MLADAAPLPQQEHAEAPDPRQLLDAPAVIARIARVSKRPRYTLLLLNLIARAADAKGSAGPYVWQDGRRIGIRDWLADAMLPLAQRDHRRVALVEKVRADLARRGALPSDERLAEQAIDREVRTRVLQSGRCSVSRSVSDLVRAGLVRRWYQGYRVDHHNRGAQREAVYTIPAEVRRALGHSV